MTFLRPEYLYGLIAILIPIVIHLFNFRRHRKLYFSDISRLKIISSHTRKKQKIKHLVVLLLRILAVILIVGAFSGPIIKDDNTIQNSESRVVALYIDNSFSMMSEGQNGRLFENARQDALGIIDHSADNTNFIFISNNTEAQNLQLLDKEAAASIIENLEITASTKKLSQIIAIRDRILTQNNIAKSDIYVFSDFQIKTTDIESFPADSTNRYFFVPLTNLSNKNIYIDSISLESSGIMTNEIVSIDIWIKNDSDEDYEKVPLSLLIDNQQKAVSGVDIKSNSTKKITLVFSAPNAGWHEGMVEIEDFPITFDDKLFFAFQVVKNIKVLIIGDGKQNDVLTKFYSSDDIFNVTEMNSKAIDFSQLFDFDLIILNQMDEIPSGTLTEFEKYISNGGNILFIPAPIDYEETISKFLKNIKAGNYIGMDTATTRVTKLKLTSPLFSNSVVNVPRNAELPTVKMHYTYMFPANSGVETLASLLSGDDFLSKKNIGSGQLFLLSVGLDKSYGNFTSQLIFSPIMHGIASKRKVNRIPYIILGKQNNYILSMGNMAQSESPLTLVSNENQTTIIPQQQYSNGELIIDLTNIDLKSDYYRIKNSDSVVGAIATNYNRDESDMNYYNSDQLRNICNDSNIWNFNIIDAANPNYKEVINALQKESDFWKLFIILALLMILFEILVLRFWK